MNKQQAFDTVVGEFRRDFTIVRTRGTTGFNALHGPKSYECKVSVSWGERDPLTGQPSKIRINVVQGPHTIHSGEWRPINQAQLAAQIATNTIRNTGYAVQGELL